MSPSSVNAADRRDLPPYVYAAEAEQRCIAVYFLKHTTPPYPE